MYKRIQKLLLASTITFALLGLVTIAPEFEFPNLMHKIAIGSIIAQVLHGAVFSD